MNIFRYAANSRNAAGALALSAALLGTSAAMAESRASGEITARPPITQTGAQNPTRQEDPGFRNQFHAWQAHDATGTSNPARISVNSAPMANIAIHADSGPGHVTVGRALDAEGAPIDFSRIRSAMPNLARKGVAGAMGAFAMPSRLPISGSALTSGFGMRRHPMHGTWRAHSGIDLAAPAGTPIYATADGMVGRAQWQGGYGLFVEMEHGGGLQTRYGHMSRLNVAPGQQMRKGDLIGYVGSTGQSTGPHLHYEIRVNGQAVNPASRGTR